MFRKYALRSDLRLLRFCNDGQLLFVFNLNLNPNLSFFQFQLALVMQYTLCRSLYHAETPGTDKHSLCRGFPGGFLHYMGRLVGWTLVVPAVSPAPLVHCFTSSTWELGHEEPLLECTVYFCITVDLRLWRYCIHNLAIPGCRNLIFYRDYSV